MADEELVVEVESAQVDSSTQVQIPSGTETRPERKRDEQGRFVSGDEAVDDLATQYAELKAKDDAREEARRAADRRAQESDQRAAEARRDAEAARSQVVDSQTETIESGLAAAQAEAEAGRRQY